MIDQVVYPIFENIIQHPFLQKLSAGTLDKKIFYFYLEQDYYYLLNYTKALLSLSNNANTIKDRNFWKACANSCTHEPAFEIRNIIVDDDSRKTNSCISYNNFINQHVLKNYENGVASVFSCAYIYFRVSKKMYPNNKNNMFMTWFDTYVSAEFVNQTQEMIELFQRQYDQSDTKSKIELLDIVKKGAQYEWHFWDDAYL